MTISLANCKGCGTSFESASASFTIAGRSVTIRESYCPTCQAEKEADLTEPEKAPLRKPWSEICPLAYQGFDFGRLPDLSRGTATQVFEWKESPRGIGLIGESRRGKTFVIHELMRRLYESRKSVRLESGTGFAYAVGSPEQSERRRVIDSCIRVDCLLIDDLDKMKLTDRVEADLFHVIEERRRAQRPMFVTLNAKGATLETMMSENAAKPIINRLREDVCRFFAI